MKFELRAIMTIKDIMNVTGYKERTARRIYNSIRKKYLYTSKAFISIKHFCEYSRIDEAVVMQYIY